MVYLLCTIYSLLQCRRIIEWQLNPNVNCKLNSLARYTQYIDLNSVCAFLFVDRETIVYRSFEHGTRIDINNNE